MNILGNKKNIFNNTDLKAVNNIKAIGSDIAFAQNKSYYKSGISAVNALYALYNKHLVFDKENKNWINRDRFILASKDVFPMLYSCLYLLGIEEDINKFQNKEYEDINGVEFNKQCKHGFATAVGVAISEKHLNNKYANKKESIIDYNTYVLCDNESIMNGTFYEAASVAGNLKLNKFIALFDNVHSDGGVYFVIYKSSY
jgi:transketolase